jgi:hypothetical protein
MEMIAAVFPHLAGLRITKVLTKGPSVRAHAETSSVAAKCPQCPTPSRRVHSRYERRLLDAAVAGQETMLHLRVRRFFCTTVECVRKIFVEQIDGLTLRHGRASVPTRRLLEPVALALDGPPVSPSRRRREAALRIALVRPASRIAGRRARPQQAPAYSARHVTGSRRDCVNMRPGTEYRSLCRCHDRRRRTGRGVPQGRHGPRTVQDAATQRVSNHDRTLASTPALTVKGRKTSCPGKSAPGQDLLLSDP